MFNIYRDQFYDWNGQRLDVSSGARFRPPVIVSSGPSLLIRFYANGGTGLGYKAFYSFVIGYTYDKSVQPITDCGGYVENLGGTITMMNMVDQGVKIYDCVWLIRPPNNFLHMKTHMYLKVVGFADMGMLQHKTKYFIKIYNKTRKVEARKIACSQMFYRKLYIYV